jgi:hypothetical protein
MADVAEDCGFIFSDGFDRLFLEELYGGDMLTAEEIFRSSIPHIEEFLQLAEHHVDTGASDDLRKLLHKIKPLFGYMGMIQVQDAAQNFEDFCAFKDKTGNLDSAHESFRTIAHQALLLMRTEQQRLNEHNNRRV